MKKSSNRIYEDYTFIESKKTTTFNITDTPQKTKQWVLKK